MESNWIKRYLNATRPQLEILSERQEVEAWVRETISHAHPGMDLSPKLLRIRSRKKRWEYRNKGDEIYIIADMALVEVVSVLFNLHSRQANSNFCHAYLYTLMADSFREQYDISRYAFCVLKAVEQQEALRRLKEMAVQQSGYSTAFIFALLHEIAHLIVNAKLPNYIAFQEMCKFAIDKHSKWIDEFLVGLNDTELFTASTGKLLEEVDRVQLFHQNKSHIGSAEHSESLEHEVTCDVIAAVSFLNVGAKVNFFDNDFPDRLPISVKEAGDALYRAESILASLQFISFLSDFCKNVAGSNPFADISKSGFEMDCRKAVVGFALECFFQSITRDLKFSSNSSFDNLTQIQKERIFSASISKLNHFFNERIYAPFDELQSIFTEPEKFESEFYTTVEQNLGLSSTEMEHNLEIIDELRDGLPL